MKNLTVKVAMMFVLILLSFTVTISNAIEFPGRADYPGIPTISLEDLQTAYSNGKAMVVDVRSGLEYDTVHIKGAFHIPLDANDFVSKVKEHSSNNPEEKIAFYCNGITCYKSYKATKKAMGADIKNVYAFDLGIPGWAEANPADTMLLGKKLTESKLQWIPKNEFKQTTLPWADFKERISNLKKEGQKFYIVDLRDAGQKNADENALKELSAYSNVISMPLDDFIKKIIDKGEMKDGFIFGFDNVGKQVRWLMYYLEESFYSRYNFLDKGISGVK